MHGGTKSIDHSRKGQNIHTGFILRSIKNPTDPVDRSAILVATATRDFKSFKGYLGCATPFEAYEIELSQGPTSISVGTEKKLQTKLPLNFLNSTWRTSDFAFVVLHGHNLDPSECSITRHAQAVWFKPSRIDLVSIRPTSSPISQT
jgi:hypothetical protein